MPPPGKDREFLWDDAIAGFGVAALASGKKVYVAQYRQAGRSRRSTIGDHGRLTPDQARSEAKKLLGCVETGADPIADRRAARAVPLFHEVAEQYLELHVAAKRKPRTLESYKSLLRQHVLPALGSLRVTDIRRAHISKLHAGLADHPATANRALAVVSAIWNWTSAERDDFDMPPNPCRGVRRNREEGRERFLSTDEFARLGDALRAAETIGLPYLIDETKLGAKHAPKPENRLRTLDPFAVAAIRLLLLTGARLSEIMTARWSDVAFERGLLNLPTSKSGKKSIVLSALALEVLTSLPRIEGNPFVIAGLKDGAPRADLHNPWRAVTGAAGLEGVRIHDLRHSFASIGAGASLGLPVIGKLLGHSQASTTHRYAHLDNDPLRRAADAIGATITGAMNREPAATVTPIKGRGRADG